MKNQSLKPSGTDAQELQLFSAQLLIRAAAGITARHFGKKDAEQGLFSPAFIQTFEDTLKVRLEELSSQAFESKGIVQFRLSAVDLEECFTNAFAAHRPEFTQQNLLDPLVMAPLAKMRRAEDEYIVSDRSAESREVQDFSPHLFQEIREDAAEILEQETAAA